MNYGTDESYFSAMSTLFEFSQNCSSWLKAITSATQLLRRQDMDLLNSRVQQHLRDESSSRAHSLAKSMCHYLFDIHIPQPMIAQKRMDIF